MSPTAGRLTEILVQAGETVSRQDPCRNHRNLKLSEGRSLCLWLIPGPSSSKLRPAAFNMHNDETTEALLWAAVEAKAPVFRQVGRAIVPHMGLKRAFETTRQIAEASDAD